MKVRQIKIGIKSWADNKRELAQVFHQVGSGKKPPAEATLYFRDVSTFRRCLTPQRLDLLWIAAEKPQSVDEIAAIVGRDARAVSQDLEYLASVGLVEFRSSRARKSARIPVVPYDRVELSVELRERAA